MWFRDPMSGQVQVEVDAALAQDLYTVITEIREQYQGLVSKSRRETGAWFKNKARGQTHRHRLHPKLHPIPVGCTTFDQGP